MNPIDSERWDQLNELFEAARGLAGAERDAFLRQACAGDAVLHDRVHQLLRADEHGSVKLPTGALVEELAQPMTPPLDVAVGRRFGPYRVVAEIGRGGMGVVYLAERADEQYDKRVAIKLIKQGVDTEAVLRLFKHERQILAALDHPNITRLMDAGTAEDGRPYFIMEYVEGTPIREYCEAHALGIRQRVELFRRVCASVAYAHRHLIVHRDIKPTNILVAANGEPKLLDFGIAKLMETDTPGETIAAGRLMTPEYASPEQAAGGAVTTLSDVYSLGIVLYELLAGRPPDRSVSELLKPSMVTARHRTLRGDLDTIVLKALRTDPARRYQSVEQLSDDLARHLDGLPIVARADAAFYRFGKFVRRNAVACSAAAVVLLTLVGGIMATTAQAQRARAQEAAARAEKARAERRFNEVRQLAHSVLFDYHDAIKDLSGATVVRERLVKDALAYLDGLAAEASGDSALQRELAAAYERVGDVRGRPRFASLGDSLGALESYSKALQLRESLTAANPRDVQARRDVAISHVRTGDVLYELNQIPSALEHLGKALDLYLGLTAEQPDNAEIRDELAATYNDIGLAMEDRGDLTGALENQRRALQVRETLFAGDPDNQALRRNLSTTYVNLGRALVLNGAIEEALRTNEKGLLIRADLFVANPTNAEYRRLLAIGYQNDGDYRAIAHDFPGALQSFRKKLALDERAFGEDPANAQSRDDITYSYRRIGFLLGKLNVYSDALSYHRRALALSERLSAEAPQIPRHRYEVLIDRANIAAMQAMLGNRSAARNECLKTLAFLNDTPADPTNTLLSSDRGVVYMILGRAHAALAAAKSATASERQEAWRTARDMFTRSLAVWDEMKKRGTLTAEVAENPGEVGHEIEVCDAHLRTRTIE
jgi:eukaryotic-like serine/threonine-protein kinase